MGYLIVSKRAPQGQLTPEQQAERKKKRMAQVAFGTNVIGLAAGSHGMYSAVKAPELRQKKWTKGKTLAAGAAALQGVNLAGDAIANRVLADSKKSAAPAVKQKKAQKVVTAKSEHGFNEEYISPIDRGNGMGLNLELVEKEFRRFDPEADRQRRYGLYAGALTGTAAAIGSRVPSNFTREVVGSDGKKLRGIAVRSGKGKGALITTLGTTAAGLGGIHVYRKGKSEANNPWN